MRFLWLLALLPGLAQAYAPFTVELQDGFEAGGSPCSSAGITIACTERGAEAVWTVTAQTGITTVSETSGSLRITSNGASAVQGRIQTKVDYRNNFFVQPLKWTFTALDFVGTVTNTVEEEFLFWVKSSDVADDTVLLSVRGNGRVELFAETDGATPIALVSSVLGWTPTDATLTLDQTSFFLRVTAAGQLATFSGAHGVDVATWGARGDSAVFLAGTHALTPANGQTAIITLGAFRQENLKFFDGFNNDVPADTGHRTEFWTDTGTVEESGNVRTITDIGSSISPLSKDFNFFGQKLKFHVKLARSFTGTSATNKIRFAVVSEAEGTGSANDAFAVAFSPDGGGRMKAGWKTGSDTAVPEDVVGNEMLNITGIAPTAFDLILDRDNWEIAAYSTTGAAIDLNGALAGTSASGIHNIPWHWWGPGSGPPQTANSAIVLEGTGAGTKISTWDRIQVERLDPYWLVPTVYGPIADDMELEIAGDLDPAAHPLLASGYLDVTKTPFLASAAGGVDATNALNHAINFARENHLSAYAKCSTQFLVSDKLVSFQALQLRTTHTLASSPNNDEEGPTVFVGESNCVTRPKLRLANNSLGFSNTASPKPIIQFWARNYNNYPADVNDNLPGISFSNQVIGIDIDLIGTPDGAWNDGACGISMQGAQGTTIEEVTINATGAFSGICGLPGGGGAMVDITVIGGATCIWGVAGPGGAAGSLMQPTITGLTCNGAPVRYDGLQTLVLVGADLTVPNGTPCIDARGGTGSGGVLLGKVSLIDSQCKFASASTTNDALDVDASFYIKNSYFQYAENIAVSGGGDLVSGQKLGWTHITEAAKGINPGLYTPANAQFLHTRYEDGALAVGDLFEETVNELPPANLQSQHLWASWPAWETASVPTGLEADFTGDQTTDIQASLTANAVTFLPRGIYAVSAGLNQGTNDLVGAGRVFTHIVTKKATGSFDSGAPEPIITTTCSDVSQAKLGNLMLHAQSQNIDLGPNPDVGGSYAFNWCAGNGVIRNLDLTRRSQFGYGNPTGTGGGSANWQLALFSANAGGKVYDLQHGEAFNHGPLWRHFKVDGTSNPLHFYHLNPEHGHGEANVEVVDSENVHIYGMKAEANLPILWIRDSDNVNMYGYGGNGAAYDPHVAISGITNANPAVVTTASNTFATGNGITLHNVSGMTQVNNVRFTIVRINATSFSLRNEADTAAINSTSYGVYAGGADTASRLEAGYDLSYTPTLFRVENTPNFRLAALFDQVRLPSPDHPVFGSGDNPGDWRMALEIPPGSSSEIVTPALERPILMRRISPEVLELITVLNTDATLADGESFTPVDGSNRMVVWGLGSRRNGSVHSQTGATLGGETMAVLEAHTITGGNGHTASLARLPEAQVALLCPTPPCGAEVADATFSVAPTFTQGGAVTLDGVNQAAPVLDAEIGDTASGTSHFLPAVNVVDGGMVVVQITTSIDFTGTPVGYIVVMNNITTDPRTVMAYKPATADGTETPVFTTGGNVVARMVVMSFAPAGEGVQGSIFRRRRAANDEYFERMAAGF